MRLAVLRRYRELVRLVRREGFGPFVSAAGREERTVANPGVRLRLVLEEAGGVYVKLGQIAATRVDLVPPEISDELAKLQNRVPPADTEAIREVLETELGDTVERVFAEFEWEPLAAASIGQTHRARLRSGEAVVVKVQRPGIRDVMERDLAALALVANLAQRRTAFGQGMRSGEMLGQFAQSLRAELDFLREADAMAEMTLLLGPTSAVRIPRVHLELSTRRLLVQERFEGFTLADTERLNASDIDRNALAEKLLASTLDQVLRLGFFHADPHPGQHLRVRGRHARADRLRRGRSTRPDPTGCRRRHPGRAVPPRREPAPRRHRTRGRSRRSDVAGASRTRARPAHRRRTCARPGPSTPPSSRTWCRPWPSSASGCPATWSILSRALVTLDGTLRILAPDLSLVAAATSTMTSEVAPIDRDEMIRNELMNALPHLRRLPDRIDRILTLTGRGDLRIRHIVDEDGRRIVRTLANRSLLAVIGAVFVLASTILLVASDRGPDVGGETGLFELLGYFGLLAGAVLMLRVVAAVARDGTT